MRALLLLILVGLAACQAPRVAVQHSKPDSAPVVRPIAQTRLALVETRAAIRNASASAISGETATVGASEHAVEVAGKAAQAAERGLVAKSAEARVFAEQASRLAAEVEELKSHF